MLKRAKEHINAIIMAFYLMCVWTAYIYLNVTSVKEYIILFMIIIYIFSYGITNFIIQKICNKTYMATNATEKNLKYIFLFFSLITVGVLLIWYVGYFPGGWSPDSIKQYEQAVTNTYNDWYPIWHTLLFFKLPITIFGKTSSIILMQIFYFALLMGYMSLIISKYVGLKHAIFSFSYIILNPYMCKIMLYPWKDVAFAMSGTLCMLIVFDIYFSYNKLQVKKSKLILLGIMMANATLFRHNAILFTGSLLLVVFLNLKKKEWSIIVVSFLLALVMVKGPVYHMIDNVSSETKISEVTGLPLTVIGNVVKETSEALDDELAEVAYSIATPEQWNSNYVCGNFNSIKWNGADLSIVETEGYIGMAKILLKCFEKSTAASIRAFISLTDMVYGIENGLEGDIKIIISDNPYNLVYSGNKKIAGFLEAYDSCIGHSIFRYIRTYGVGIVIMVLAILGNMQWGSWKCWKKKLLCIPILIYDFGTMLLLTGDDSRFFFITFLLVPLTVFLALYDREEKTNG